MKRKISFVLAMLMLALAFGGCNKPAEKDGTDGKDPGKIDLSGVEIPDEHIPLVGDVTSVWFDELFAAYYPSQLDGTQEVIFSKAYFYGDAQTKQPVMCLCSKPISNISLFAVTDGVRAEELYTVEKLEPMEVIWIFPELAVQGSANIGISFSDEAGNTYSYTLAKNEAGNEVVVEPIA